MESETLLALLAFVLPLALLVSGVVVIFAALRYRTRQRELLHQERLAMIEKGMMPPPELTPFELVRGSSARLSARPVHDKSLSIGIIIVGLGLGFMSLIGIAAAAPEVGIGLGGAIVILGGAFIVRALVARTGEPAGPAIPPGPRPNELPPTPPPPPTLTDR
jgi:hypothetical protein